MKKGIKGVSFTLVIGSYGGFHFVIKDWSIRLCIGWIAFTIYSYDLEEAIDKLIKSKNKEFKKPI